ncbi:MAG: NAD(P)-binding domain-containing protein [Anaerolineae bacterium]
MKIGILGAGTVGGNLGRGWARHGHEVMFSSRDPHSDTMRALTAETGAKAGTPQQTLDFGEVVAIALRWDVLPGVVKSLSGWDNKIIIDATNRFGPPPADSIGTSSQDIAHWTQARLVKCFNSIGAEHFINPVFNGLSASAFLCGDDPDARKTVSQLAADLGFDPVDMGELAQEGALSALAQVWVGMSRTGFGRNIAFKLLRR